MRNMEINNLLGYCLEMGIDREVGRKRKRLKYVSVYDAFYFISVIWLTLTRGRAQRVRADIKNYYSEAWQNFALGMSRFLQPWTAGYEM